MNGLTDYITERTWMDTITTWYVLVDDAYVRLVVRRGDPCARVGRTHVSDSEVITIR